MEQPLAKNLSGGVLRQLEPEEASRASWEHPVHLVRFPPGINLLDLKGLHLCICTLCESPPGSNEVQEISPLLLVPLSQLLEQPLHLLRGAFHPLATHCNALQHRYIHGPRTTYQVFHLFRSKQRQQVLRHHGTKTLQECPVGSGCCPDRGLYTDGHEGIHLPRLQMPSSRMQARGHIMYSLYDEVHEIARSL